MAPVGEMTDDLVELDGGLLTRFAFESLFVLVIVVDLLVASRFASPVPILLFVV